MTCPQTSTLGVYLLGALEPEERSTFESHMYGCDVCRAELVRLAPLPGLLNQISLADFDETGATTLAVLEAPAIDLPPLPMDELDEPPEPPAGEPDTPDEPKPRRRFWLAAAAAALVVALTVAAVLSYNTLRQGPPAAQAETWSATNVATGARADVTLTQKSWGTGLQVWMSNVPPGRECKLIVQAKNGYHDAVAYKEVAGWWRTDHDEHEEVPGATSIDLDMIHQLQFVDDNGVVLVDMHSPR